MKTIKLKFCVLLCLILPTTIFAQRENLFAGIEVSSKSLKTSDLEFTNFKKGMYKDFKTNAEMKMQVKYLLF